MLRCCRTVRPEEASDEVGKRVDGGLERREPVGVRVGDVAAAVGSVAEHTGIGGVRDRLPPARPVPLEGGHHQIARPGPGPGDHLNAELVNCQVVVSQSRTDRGDHLSSLLRRHPHRRRSRRDRPLQRRQRTHPTGQLICRQQMHSPPRPKRLHQTPVNPQSPLNVLPSPLLHPNRNRDLPRRQHLRMSPSHRPHHLRRPAHHRTTQPMPPHPPPNNRFPTQNTHSKTLEREAVRSCPRRLEQLKNPFGLQLGSTSRIAMRRNPAGPEQREPERRPQTPSGSKSRRLHREALEEASPLGVPRGDVLHQIGQLEGKVASTGVLEVDDPDPSPVPEIVRKIRIPVPDDDVERLRELSHCRARQPLLDRLLSLGDDSRPGPGRDLATNPLNEGVVVERPDASDSPSPPHRHHRPTLCTG